MSWIKTSDELPTDDEIVIVLQEGHEYSIPIICWYYNKEGFLLLHSHQDIVINCKYWMYLPKRPKEDE